LSWLQFSLQPAEKGHTRLTLRAHFIPDPVWGHVYWTLLSKFHIYILRGKLNYFDKVSVQSIKTDSLNTGTVPTKA
jgi:hypothetical protein